VSFNRFVEVFNVTSALSLSLSKPRQHSLDMTVEVIMAGRIDECVNLFIRRVLEEAHTSEASHSILTAHLTVSM
jgi:hypothetical protein